MTRDEMTREMKAKIDDWNARIGEIEAELERRSAEVNKDYRQKLAELKALRDRGEEKLRDVRRESEASFDEAESKVKSAWQDIADGFEKARARFH